MDNKEYLQYMNGRPPDRIMEPLVKRWYMIHEGMDAIGLCYMFRQFLNDSANHKLEKLNGYTIFTTTNCNARCPYCYEKKYRRRDMDSKTAGDVAGYIRRTVGKEAALHWFGGEPLCNMEVIDVICGRLNEYRIPYYSSMISNGYLLDKPDISTVKELWKLKRVQITLDGTESAYNTTKRFICEDPSPFKKIINNIGRMTENEIEVVARLNVSEENVEDMHGLVDFLSREFSGERYFSAYLSPLFEEDGKKLYEGCLKIQGHINNASIGRMRAARVNPSCCMADNRKSVIITPEGNLGLCEHHADDEYIGNIYSNNLDIPMIESWAERNEDAKCLECVLYPQCIQLKKCPSAKCSVDKQLYMINRVKMFALQEYKKYKGVKGE